MQKFGNSQKADEPIKILYGKSNLDVYILAYHPFFTTRWCYVKTLRKKGERNFYLGYESPQNSFT